MGETTGINFEILNNKKCVMIEGLLHIDINHSVKEMVELLEEARKTGKELVYDAKAVCFVFNFPEYFRTYLSKLPMNKHFQYGRNKITRVSENLYAIE